MVEKSGWLKTAAQLFGASAALAAAGWGLDTALSMVFGGGAAGEAAKFTQRHFLDPALPRFSGVGFWGMALLAAAVPLSVILLADGVEGTQNTPAPESRAKGRDNARLLFGIGAAALAIAFAVRTAMLEPVPLGEGRLRAAARFFTGFNRAAFSKSRFDEKKYMDEMAEALLSDRKTFFAFARSAYWATFADENATRWSDRKRPAALVLYSYFESGRLSDDDSRELAALCREAGLAAQAETVLKALSAAPSAGSRQRSSGDKAAAEKAPAFPGK